MKHEYESYREWKGWAGFGALSRMQARYFGRELAVLGPLRGKCVLEVGFGNGAFLAYAHGQGAEVHGTEMIPELITAARKAGFDAGDNSGFFGVDGQAGRFDAVVAFDVLEHMDKMELTAFFGQLHELLKPGGLFVARFPNGHSPFGRLYQNGDITHKTSIGRGLIGHLAAVSGLQVVTVRNQRIQFLDNPLWAAVQSLQRGLRTVVEFAVGYIYFNRREPLDPNLVAVLIKPR